jgi:glycosyltransferase involved in cell wall biosynthesis
MNASGAGGISFVIPVYNERDSLAELFEYISKYVSSHAAWFEVIFVDDGSNDGSTDVLISLCKSNANAKLLRLPVNYGKAEALDLGFRNASGDIIITMDADLQDDPAEIPNFLAKIKEGFDLVSGWKQVRNDPWHKVIPSRAFNFVVRKVFKIPLHDFNCGYKAYRRELVENLHLYGELHRFLPVIAGRMGARIAEIPVKHSPRKFGKSKYGLDRMLKGFMDLITVAITTRFLKRPLHFFGTAGLLSACVGGMILLYLVVLWFAGERPIGNRPLFFFGILMTLLGVQIFSLGIMAELFIHFQQKHEKPPVSLRIGFAETAQGEDR